MTLVLVKCQSVHAGLGGYQADASYFATDRLMLSLSISGSTEVEIKKIGIMQKHKINGVGELDIISIQAKDFLRVQILIIQNTRKEILMGT